MTWLSRKIWTLTSILSLSNFWNLVLPEIFKALTELCKYPSFLKIGGRVSRRRLLNSPKRYWCACWILLDLADIIEHLFELFQNEFKVILSWPFLIAIFISPYEVAGEFLDYLLNSGWELLFISCQIDSLGDNSPLCECHGYSLVFCL